MPDVTVTLSTAKADAALKSHAYEVADGQGSVRRRHGFDGTRAAALAAGADAVLVVPVDLPAVLEQQGIDYRSYREDVRREMMLAQLRQRDVYSRIYVSPREIEQALGPRFQQACNRFFESEKRRK